jgi:hypothetical protein
MSLVHNEQTKLLAALLNTLAGGVILAGVIAPLAALSFGLTSAPGIAPVWVYGLNVIWLSVGAGLHYIARLVLRRLRP